MRILEYFTDEHLLPQVFAGFPTWVLLSAIAATVYLLSKGADWMIDGAVCLALRTKLPKIVIGATILSLGTTAPEAFVSVMAAFMGNPGLALGNGVGSIIADTGLIFGLVVITTAPPLSKWILNRTGWWQIGSALLLVLFATAAILIDPKAPVISQWMGLVLVCLLGVYLWMSYKWARTGGGQEEVRDDKASIPTTLVLLLGGLFFVILASRLLIPAVSEIARRFGVPEDIIAATMVALGTSLPELTTAIAAIRKGHPEITIGNIVGADVLNSLFVIGLASLAVPLEVPINFFRFHFPVMILILLSFRLFIRLDKAGRFKRWQGAYLLAVYAAYIVSQYIIF